MSSGQGEEDDVEAGGPRLPSFSFANSNLEAEDDEEEEESDQQVFIDVHVATEHKSDPPFGFDRAAPAPSSPPSSSRGQAFALRHGDELPLEDDGRDEDEDSDDSEDLSDDEAECCGGGTKSKANKKAEVYQGTSIKQCGGRGVSSGRDRGVFYMTLSLIILPALVFYSCLYALARPQLLIITYLLLLII